MLRTFAIIPLIVMLLSSCGINTTMVQSLNLNQTQVTLDQANFVVVGQVTGKDSATYILGIGGLRNRSTLQNAHSDMLKRADLSGKSRAIINVTYETHIANVLGPIYLKKTVYVHGLVVEFVGHVNQGPADRTSSNSAPSQVKEPTVASPGVSTNESILEESNSSSGNTERPVVEKKEYQIEEFSIGDRVKFILKGVDYEGKIEDVRPASTNGLVIRYTDAKGKQKQAYLKASDILLKF